MIFMFTIVTDNSLNEKVCSVDLKVFLHCAHPAFPTTCYMLVLVSKRIIKQRRENTDLVNLKCIIHTN